MARRKRKLYPGYQELEIQLVSAVHGDESIGVYPKDNSWKPLNPGHRVFLFYQRIKCHHIWRIKKRQSLSLSLRFLYYMFQTDFSPHYPPASNTELSFQPIWSVHVFPEYIAFCCLLVDASYFDSEHILSLGYAPHLSSKLPNLTHLPRTNLSSSPSRSLPGIFQVSVIISFSDWLIHALAPHFKIRL